MTVQEDIPYPAYLKIVSEMPARLKYAHIVYNLLLTESKLETIEVPAIFNSLEKIEAHVYRGSFGDIYAESGASRGYYRDVRELLTACGAVTFLERGTVRTPSVIVVDPSNRPPLTSQEVDAVLGRNVKSSSQPLTESSSAFKMLLDRLDALERQTGGGQLNLTEAFRNIEGRLSELESKTGIKV